MMNRLRCLRNSLAVWFGSNARWTALVKLQANKKIYDFRFFFVLGSTLLVLQSLGQLLGKG